LNLVLHRPLQKNMPNYKHVQLKKSGDCTITESWMYQ
jgi:hypothetical protein